MTSDSAEKDSLERRAEELVKWLLHFGGDYQRDAANAVEQLLSENRQVLERAELAESDLREMLRAGLGDAKHDTDVSHEEALLILRAHLEAFNEREELRAENERWREHHESDERLRLKYLAERDTALAALEKERESLVSARAYRDSARERITTLESRYSALEKALRDAVEAADAGSGTVSLKELRRILALTPKEGE